MTELALSAGLTVLLVIAIGSLEAHMAKRQEEDAVQASELLPAVHEEITSYRALRDFGKNANIFKRARIRVYPAAQ